MILSTAYFPPIEFFAILAKNSVVRLESCEHYQKQSWRNRCRILSANGPLDLRVPIVHGHDLYHSRITDVQVDYSTPWIAQTKYAIESAYYSSPFFIYYKDALFSIFDSQPESLWDLNLQFIQFFIAKIGLKTKIIPTETYLRPSQDLIFEEDYRDRLHPKKSSDYKPKEYWQVFREKFGFVPGLSIMDLLFNEGPESICYLK